jgi:hypothetical protein
MTVYACKNHKNKLWYNTKPGGQLVFLGELRKNGTVKDAQPLAPIAHIRLLKAYINGYNPFAEDMKEEPHIKTIEDVRNFLTYVDTMERKYAFECECAPGNLEKIDGDPDELLNKVTNEEVNA